MSNACQAKCVPPKYKDAELAKGEAVCIDRCVAKYLDVHDRIGKKLTAMSTQDEETMKKLQGQMQGAPKWYESYLVETSDCSVIGWCKV